MQDIVLDVNEDAVNKLHPELLTTLEGEIFVADGIIMKENELKSMLK